MMKNFKRFESLPKVFFASLSLIYSSNMFMCVCLWNEIYDNWNYERKV
jgi:hypothetical protein